MHQIAGSLLLALALGGPALMLIILITLAITTARIRGRIVRAFA